MCTITYAGLFLNCIFRPGRDIYYWRLINYVVTNYGFGVHQWNVLFTEVMGGLKVYELRCDYLRWPRWDSPVFIGIHNPLRAYDVFYQSFGDAALSQSLLSPPLDEAFRIYWDWISSNHQRHVHDSFWSSLRSSQWKKLSDWIQLTPMR